MEKAVAVFDLEGTLFRRSSSFMREIRNNRKKGIISTAKVAIVDISLVVIFICYKMHLVGELTMRVATFQRLATLLKGSTEKEIAKRARVFAAKFKDYLRSETSEILEEHKRKGHTTILLSGMLQPYIESVKQELGIDIAIGTELEIKDGWYIGRLAMVPYFAERRAQALSELINTLGYEVNLGESYAYGDAIFDRYFMGMIAVYPDKKLVEYAKEHGWKVIT